MDKWVEVGESGHTFAINSRNVFLVAPEKIREVVGLTAYFAAEFSNPITGGVMPTLSGRFFTKIGPKPATIENWLQAVES